MEWPRIMQGRSRSEVGNWPCKPLHGEPNIILNGAMNQYPRKNLKH